MHYYALLGAYAVVSAIVWLTQLWVRPAFLGPVPVGTARPRLELALLLLAVVGVLGVGQLYTRHLLLDGRNPVFEAANQILIFSPVLIALAFRKRPFSSGGLPPTRWPALLFGLALALAALGVYLLVRGAPERYGELVQFVFAPDKAKLAVQVLLEDIAIAALLLSLAAAVGPRIAIGVVAALFAAAHIPAMLAAGASVDQLTSLLGDTLLGVVMLGAVLRTRSVWWLFPVHFVMDMTQFFTL